MASDAIGAVGRWLADVVVGSAVDASEDALPRFGRRHPRALRFARLGGGAFLALVGFYEALLCVVVFVYVAITGDFDDRVLTPVLLIPLSLGVGITVWGLRMVRRGWASRGLVGAALTDDDYSLGGRRTGGRLMPESHNVEGATVRWLRIVFGLVLWIAGSVIAIFAGVPDGYAMLLGSLLPITLYLVYRRRRAAGRY
jgi:hypothetical protein